MKKLIAETLRDTRVVAVSVLASGLLLGGTVVSAQNVAFQPARAAAAPGQVLKGDYSLGGATDGNAVANDDIKLPRALRYPIAGNRAQIIPPGGPYTANCPAVGQVVPRGWLCVYERHHEGSAVYLTMWNPSTGNQGNRQEADDHAWLRPNREFRDVGSACWRRHHCSWHFRGAVLSSLREESLVGPGEHPGPD